MKAICKVLFLIQVLAGCSPLVTHPSPASDLESVAAQADPPYRIGPGDKLALKFFFVPEMDAAPEVGPDGRISVMFVKEIEAAGLTSGELARILEKKLAPYVKQPDVEVSVSRFASQKVYVGGEVTKPGTVPLTRRMRLTQVLAEAGWMTPLASKEEIVILRHAEEGREAAYHVNPGKILSGEDFAQDVVVQAGDVILVPPSSSVDFDRWMDRNIKHLIPFGASVNYNYSNYYGGSLP